MDSLGAGLLAAAYFLKRRSPRGACVIFGAALSHWLLDWISRRPDMPLAPGLHRNFGLGLWKFHPSAVIIEGGFRLLAVILNARATHAKKRTAIYASWTVFAILARKKSRKAFRLRKFTPTPIFIYSNSKYCCSSAFCLISVA